MNLKSINNLSIKNSINEILKLAESENSFKLASFPGLTVKSFEGHYKPYYKKDSKTLVVTPDYLSDFSQEDKENIVGHELTHHLQNLEGRLNKIYYNSGKGTKVDWVVDRLEPTEIEANTDFPVKDVINKIIKGLNSAKSDIVKFTAEYQKAFNVKLYGTELETYISLLIDKALSEYESCI